MTTYLGSSAVAGTPGVEGDNTAGGLGVFGKSMTGTSAGVQGNAGAGIGVYGTAAANGTAVMGEGGFAAVVGKNYTDSGIGLQAYVTGASARGLFSQVTGAGSYGLYSVTSGNSAIAGYFDSTTGTYTTALTAYGNWRGINASCESGGIGAVVALAPYGTKAGYFTGDVSVSGTLTKGAGTFTIDHPLDPENKILNHSFVESPDMKNVYDGVIMADEKGNATVQMPSYFEALNKDFRYQLTAIGVSAPGLFISKKINGNTFSISGGEPNMEISWQITGSRKDAFALANPVIAEVDKTDKQKGSFLHPEVFGHGFDRHMNKEAHVKTKDMK